MQSSSPLERQGADGAGVDQPDVNRVDVVLLGRLRGELGQAPAHLTPVTDPLGLVQAADVTCQVGGEPEALAAPLARDLPGLVVLGQVASVGRSVVETLAAHGARQAKHPLVLPSHVAAQPSSRLEHRPAVLANVQAGDVHRLRGSMLRVHVPLQVLLVFGGERAPVATAQRLAALIHIHIVAIHSVLSRVKGLEARVRRV